MTARRTPELDNIPSAFFTDSFLHRGPFLRHRWPCTLCGVLIVPVIEVVNHCYLSHDHAGSTSVPSRSRLTRKIDIAFTERTSECRGTRVPSIGTKEKRNWEKTKENLLATNFLRDVVDRFYFRFITDIRTFNAWPRVAYRFLSYVWKRLPINEKLYFFLSLTISCIICQY